MNQPSDKIPLAALRLRITAAAVLVCGIGLAAYFSAARSADEARELDAAINTECDGFAVAVAREFESFAAVLQSIRQLHTLSTHITDADFREFVTKGLVHQTAILHAFGFAQSISDAERKNIERADSGPRALRLVEPDGAGALRAAANRPQYFPVTYQFPDDGLGIPNGFDLAVTPEMAGVIGRMAMAGGLAVTGPGYGPDRRDHLALAPIIYVVNSPDGLPTGGFLSGFAVGLLRPISIIEPSVKLAASRGLRLSLAARAPEETEVAAARERAVPVLGQIWSLRCEAGPDYIRRHRTGQPRLILASGLAVTGLLMLQLLVLARRAATIERAVGLRTAELERAIVERRRLEQEVLDISTQEKQRVGRDLHDSLGQKLTGATYLARALAGELADANAPQHEAAAKINEVLKDATAQARRIARGLSPIDLSEGGLADALRRLAEETSAVFNLSCTFHGDTAPAAIPAATATHLFLMAQEAVNNSVKHGAATEITLLLESSDGGADLVIEDNGRGLPPNATQTGGMGLRILRYRAGLIGAELKIERGREGGTVVHCRFPVQVTGT